MSNLESHSSTCECLKFKPVIVGALVAVGLSFLLNLFGIAIGLSAFTTNKSGVVMLALGGLIGVALGIVSSMFAAGWLAGYLGNRHCTKRHLGALYGFLTWCVAILIMIFLADPIQHYIILYTQTISNHMINISPNGKIIMALPAHENNAENITLGAYILFCLFFLSAFSCSLGGHCGMRYVNKDELIK